MSVAHFLKQSPSGRRPKPSCQSSPSTTFFPRKPLRRLALARCVPQGVKGSVLDTADRQLARDIDLLTIGNKAAAYGEVLSKYLKGTNIFLVGMMGSGKTVIGQQLLRRLPGYRFIDTDQLIEGYTGRSVSAIFETEGEASFRKLETEVLTMSANESMLIVATGGGAVERSENWEQMRKGVVYWLDGSLEMIAQRLLQDVELRKRPLLEGAAQGETSEEKVSGIAAQLRSIYDRRVHRYQLADFQVPLDSDVPQYRHGATPNQVVCTILEVLYDELMSLADDKKNNGEVLDDGNVEVSVAEVAARRRKSKPVDA